MKLKIHFFNVNHGDSIVIEISSKDNPDKYIVIDSSLRRTKSGDWVNPAYEYLKTREATTVNGLVITHLHYDHYAGVEKILQNLKVQRVIIPPFLSQRTTLFNAILRKYRDKITEVLKRTDDEIIRGSMKSMAYLLNFLSKKTNQDKVQELFGPENVLRIPGISEAEVTGRVYLPLPRIKGVLHAKLQDPNFDFEPFPEWNDASIALGINFCGRKLLFTGDSTCGQWREHRRQMKRTTLENLGAHFLKVPHHGSRENNTEWLYDYLLATDAVSPHVFISANGKSHPHKELFDLVTKRALRPHCTNLSDFCIAPNVVDFPPISDLPASMRPFLVHYTESEPTACQGDIKLTIDSTGFCVENSTGLPCVYDC